MKQQEREQISRARRLSDAALTVGVLSAAAVLRRLRKKSPRCKTQPSAHILPVV